MSKFPKIVVDGVKARDAMIKGMNIMANAVASTLGPRSRNVAVDKVPGLDIAPAVLHDGVSVSKSIIGVESL